VTVTAYCCWEFESQRKREFIQMAEITKLNKELKNILTSHMPDAILVMSEKT
jgi:predicted MPP superfamily phosphohydrolase